MRVLWSLEQWAEAVTELPAIGRLPTRTALVPNSRVAHALRVELINSGRSETLIGTRFITLLQLATNILLEAGEPHLPNDRELGPSFTHDAFVHADLKRFKLSDLQARPGWDISFIRTISDLDAAWVSPDQCLASTDPHVADVGRVHKLLRDRTELRTTGAIMARAAAHAPSYSDRSPTLAVLTGFESPAELSLLRSLPHVTLAAWAVRPRRSAYLQRFQALLGEHLDATAHPHPSGVPSRSALEHLQERMFDERSTAPAPSDGSVTIALYAGVHEEVEAATSWVTREILEHGVAAQDIAILTPNAEPYGSLLRARIGAIAADPPLATFSERGVPLCEQSDGTRLLLVLRALQHGLSRAHLAQLLPIIRVADEEGRVRSQAHAWEVLNTVAATSGVRSPDSEGPVWLEAWANAIAGLGAAPHVGGALEERDVQRRTEQQRILDALTPAIEALTHTLAAVASDEPLHLLWSRLSDLLHVHIKLPPSVPPATAALDRACDQFRGYEHREPRGADALTWLEENLRRISVRSARFGEPAVYLGTLAGARGLRFRAVRILGLAEGAVPSAVREDPVLSDAARAQLSPFLLGSRQRAHRQLSAFDDGVRSARERLCLSAPRASIEGSVRQPASVLLDVVRALTGSNARLEEALEHAAASGRARERDARDRYPVSYDAQLDRVARRDLQAVSETDPALSLDMLQRIRDRDAASEQDGLLPGILPAASIAGLTPEKPISASRLSTLLSCPHRFLYESILGFREAEGPLQTHSLQLMRFGTWLHGIAEEFWTKQGVALASRQGDLALAQKHLRELACERFEALQQTYPFANPLVAQAEREALCDQLDKLLLLDWNGGKEQAFVAVERAFGYEGECDITTEAGPLYLRGKIDKLDRIDGTLVVRDIKTGAGKPRRAKERPDAGIDLQLAVYALVAKRMAGSWGTPEDVAVAYIYLRSGQSDRSWWGADYTLLEQATKTWLATAREILELGAFARTPRAEDCRYCPFKPVCAPEMQRAAAVLDDPRVPKRLKLLKLPEVP